VTLDLHMTAPVLVEAFSKIRRASQEETRRHIGTYGWLAVGLIGSECLVG
jgi:hypothetical protein